MPLIFKAVREVVKIAVGKVYSISTPKEVKDDRK